MLIRIKLFILAFIFTLIPLLGMAQGNVGEVEHLKSSLRISFSTQLLMQRSSESLSNSALFADQDKLFYRNPAFGLNLDWHGWSNIALNARISYYSGSASHFEERTGIIFGLPGLFDDNYDFRLVLLEPGLKLTLPFKNFEVFWTGGPTFGFGSLNLEVQVTPFRYENDEAIPRHDDTFKMNHEGNRRNIGYYFSTGFSLPISTSFRFQGEIGYRNLDLEEFEIFQGGINRFSRLNYHLDSFTPTLSITYVIR